MRKFEDHEILWAKAGPDPIDSELIDFLVNPELPTNYIKRLAKDNKIRLLITFEKLLLSDKYKRINSYYNRKENKWMIASEENDKILNILDKCIIILELIPKYSPSREYWERIWDDELKA